MSELQRGEKGRGLQLSVGWDCQLLRVGRGWVVVKQMSARTIGGDD